ncbi:MAG: hypothetical protein L0241_16170, partial [Planctomycetia bacterium]|nr:hypothetical protein [Planctomycetia bacterium]
MNSFAQKKVLVFGALGALGCLFGWAAGEGLLAAALTSRTDGENTAPSLATRPEAPPKLVQPADRTPPSPAPTIAKRPTPGPAAPPNPLAPTIAKRAAPPPLPPEIQKRLDQAGGKSGQLQFTLIWNNINDLDLHCTDPNGETISFRNKKATKGSGGHLDVDRNVSGETRTPVENIYFPTGAPLGRYHVFVHHFKNHGDDDPTAFTVNLLIEDRRLSFEGKLSDGDNNKTIYKFDLPGIRIGVPAEVVVYPGGTNKFRVKLQRDRRNDAPVGVSFAGETAGLTLPDEVTIPGNREAEIEVAAGPMTTPGSRIVRVVAAGKFGNTEASVKITVAEPPATLQLAVPSEVKLFPGGKNQFQVLLARQHKDPVRLSFTGDTTGLKLPELLTIPGDRSETMVEVVALPTAAGGTRTFKLVAEGKHGKIEEPCNVTVEIPPTALQLAAPKSVSVPAGGDNRLTVRVAREWFDGPVTVRAITPTGVTARELTIPAGQEEGELVLAVKGEQGEGAFPVTLTAEGGTAKAETKLTLEVLPLPPPSAPAWSWRMVIVIGLWTALLAVGLSLALVVSQNRYLGRSWVSGRQAAIILAGGGLAGVIAGAIGQTLFGLMARSGVMPEVGFLAGWLLLGGLLGRGVGFFIPNLHPWRSALAGVIGGLLGAVAFILISKLGNMPGRLVGAIFLGCCIG